MKYSVEIKQKAIEYYLVGYSAKKNIYYNRG